MAKPSKHRGKWRIRWFDENDRRLSAVFDDYNVACFQLRKREIEVEEIKAGLRLPRPPEKTFSELCDYWLENRAPYKRDPQHDVSIIRRHLRPSFGALRLPEISVAHVDAWVKSCAHLHPKTINNILTLLISILNVARDLGWLSIKPRIKKPKVRIFSENFHYLRTNEGIERFLQVARTEGENVFILYATAIFTGMRAGELAGLRWDDVDFEKRLITVQRSFTGPTKSGDVRYVPILDSLLPILRQWRLMKAGDFVFTHLGNGMLQPSARIFQEKLKRVLQRAGFTLECERGRRKGYIVFHDLRHTFASHWMMNGGDVFKLQKILGHKSIQMTMRYAHLSPCAFSSDYHLFKGIDLNSGAQIIPIANGISAKPAPKYSAK